MPTIKVVNTQEAFDAASKIIYLTFPSADRKLEFFYLHLEEREELFVYNRKNKAAYAKYRTNIKYLTVPKAVTKLSSTVLTQNQVVGTRKEFFLRDFAETSLRHSAYKRTDTKNILIVCHDLTTLAYNYTNMNINSHLFTLFLRSLHHIYFTEKAGLIEKPKASLNFGKRLFTDIMADYWKGRDMVKEILRWGTAERVFTKKSASKISASPYYFVDTYPLTTEITKYARGE